MTTKILTGTYSAGYALHAPITTLSIASTGLVYGGGVETSPTATSAYAVVNDGRILAPNTAGVDGVYLAAGGSVVNGTGADTAAEILGYRGVKIAGAPGTVTNIGFIEGDSRSGVWLAAGGLITNGYVGDETARIQSAGATAININGRGTVRNYGIITPGVQFIYAATGTVINGSATDTAAVISGRGSGIYFYKGTGRVINYATIYAGSAAHDVGLFFGGAGRLTNGAPTDAAAYVEGYDGVVVAQGGSIVNYGVIDGTGAAAGGAGIILSAGGKVVNGGVTDRAALIEGYNGVVLEGKGTIANYGVINATGGPKPIRQGPETTSTLRGVGVYVSGGGNFVNGSASDQGALVQGYRGVVGDVTLASATVTNFGTIEGSSGIAVKLGGSGQTLVVEGGCAFEGAVDGGGTDGYGALLELASGVGTLSNFGTSSVTVSGSMAKTTFTDFNVVEVGAGASFKTSHPVTIGASFTLIDAGTLSLGAASMTVTVAAHGSIETLGSGVATATGAIANNGELVADGGVFTVDGAVTGSGSAGTSGGTLDFRSTFNQNVDFGSSGVLELSQSQTYTGTLEGFSTSGATSLDLRDIGFVSGTEATFSGSSSSGILTVTDGVHTARIALADRNYLKTTFIASRDGHGGVIVTDQPTGTVAPPHPFIAAMAAMGAPAGALTTHGQAPAVHAPLLTAPRTSVALV